KHDSFNGHIRAKPMKLVPCEYAGRIHMNRPKQCATRTVELDIKLPIVTIRSASLSPRFSTEKAKPTNGIHERELDSVRTARRSEVTVMRTTSTATDLTL